MKPPSHPRRRRLIDKYQRLIEFRAGQYLTAVDQRGYVHDCGVILFFGEGSAMNESKELERAIEHTALRMLRFVADDHDEDANNKLYRQAFFTAVKLAGGIIVDANGKKLVVVTMVEDVHKRVLEELRRLFLDEVVPLLHLEPGINGDIFAAQWIGAIRQAADKFAPVAGRPLH